MIGWIKPIEFIKAVGIGGGVAPTPEERVVAQFAAGEQGGWFDFSLLSSLSQDAAGAVPATGAGNSIGRAADLSGRANHLVRYSSDSRLPLLGADGDLLYITTQGLNDGMVTAPFAADGDFCMSAVVSCSLSNGQLVTFFNAATTNQVVTLAESVGGVAGTARAVIRADTTSTTYSTGDYQRQIVTFVGVKASRTVSIYRNGALLTSFIPAETAWFDTGGTNKALAVLFSGIAASAFAGGRVYSLIARWGPNPEVAAGAFVDYQGRYL